MYKMKIYELFIFIVSIVVFYTITTAGETVTAESTGRIQQSYIGTNQTKRVPIVHGTPCRNDTDCGYSETCYDNHCERACRLRDRALLPKCGKNAYCYISPAHISHCGCYPTHSGDPYSGCLQPTDFLENLRRRENLWQPFESIVTEPYGTF